MQLRICGLRVRTQLTRATALLQDSFDYDISEEPACEALDQHASFSTNPSSYENAASGSIFRLAGQGPMGQQQRSIHPLALHGTNGAYEYRPQSMSQNASDGQ